jgi:oligoendopeptidase F
MTRRDPAASIARLIALLDVQPQGDDVFRGRSTDEGWQRVYGGQVVAQALMAASKTVDGGRLCHSMHSYYSAANQPFQYYNYTIFVAEVASTFNEQLLAHQMIRNATTKEQKAAIINHEIDSIRATVVRQTMFAEFEKITHEMAESGEPLTVESMKSVYRNLLDAYFGPDFIVDEELSLECFRIPHFYRGFYVYKYATGLSAAIALSRRVLEGGQSELNDYLGFLKGGCSQDPLELLRGAGVDMTQTEPVETALSRFASLVEQLDELI